jgi:L-lactate dehydrogenase
VAQQPGETRLQLVQRNTEIFASFMEILAKRNPHALFCIVTNPVDIMTRVALELSGLPPHQLFGSGTVLDTARFRVLIARHFDVQPRHVHAHVIGEHGDSEVLVWSRASIGPYRVGEYAQVGRQSLAPDDMERISNEVRDAAYYIIERKGATHFAIGLATVHLLEALAQQQQSIYTVSRQCEGAFGLRGVCLSLPTYLNRGGATGQLEAEISGREEDALKRSAEVLAETYDALPMG